MLRRLSGGEIPTTHGGNGIDEIVAHRNLRFVLPRVLFRFASMPTELSASVALRTCLPIAGLLDAAGKLQPMFVTPGPSVVADIETNALGDQFSIDAGDRGTRVHEVAGTTPTTLRAGDSNIAQVFVRLLGD